MTPNEEQSRFYEAIGRCIAQWSHVEDSLYEAYATSIHQAKQQRTTNIALQAGFYVLSAPDAKISVADSAVRVRLLFGMGADHGDPQRRLYAAWEKLKKSIDERRIRRNQIAHFQVLIDLRGPEGRRLSLKPALFNPNVLLKTKTAIFRL